MITLRKYQDNVKRSVESALGRGENPLLVIPTGGGKTVIFSSVIHDHAGRSLAVVHRKEIVKQISLSLGAFGVRHRIVAPPPVIAVIRRAHLRKYNKSFVDQHAGVGVASVQTLTSAATSRDIVLKKFLDQVSLCVFDEAHHYVQAGTWAKAVELVHNANILGVTATPERADGLGLGSHADGFFDTMILGPTVQWLINNNFLSKFRYFTGATDLDVSDIPVTASGDFNAKALRARVVDSHLVGDTFEHWKKHALGKRTIVFTTDVKTAGETAAKFKAGGVTCEALSGETDTAIRDKVLEDFEAGRTLVLVNCFLFDEGFDVPAVECVVQAAPTESLSRYLQQIGRGLRIMDGKPAAIVIDMVKNWERHGMPNWDRVWSLDGREKRGGTSSAPTMKACGECTQPYEAYLMICPYCGARDKPQERKTIPGVKGDLFELDVDAIAQLFTDHARANMSAEDFESDMIARNVPPIGRSRQLKAHESTKYRRGVLNNLIGWWFGCQPVERDTAEKQRRFYLRFGVDVMTALTLDNDKTEKLINNIKDQFDYDLLK